METNNKNLEHPTRCVPNLQEKEKKPPCPTSQATSQAPGLHHTVGHPGHKEPAELLGWVAGRRDECCDCSLGCAGWTPKINEGLACADPLPRKRGALNRKTDRMNRTKKRKMLRANVKVAVHRSALDFLIQAVGVVRPGWPGQAAKAQWPWYRNPLAG